MVQFFLTARISFFLRYSTKSTSTSVTISVDEPVFTSEMAVGSGNTSPAPAHQLQIFPFINMHHSNLILIPPEPIHTVHIADQRLETFVRNADDELQLQLPRIAQADLAPFLIHLGKCLIQ